MALKREYTLTINKKSSVLNKNLTISTNDKGIDIIFRLIDCPYVSLSLKKNLYARVILLDPLGKQIDSDITSIVENRVLFRLTKNLMSKITEAGIYKLYIAIMDDKNNVNLLPPVKCTIEESEVEVRGLSTGMINQSSIDNSLSTDYGNEISLFNADGTYNRTVWISGDMITTARMNKLEDAASKARDVILTIRDEIKELDSNRIHKVLIGTENENIVISNLPKGFYSISGYVKDFIGKDPYKLDGENYFMVTYMSDGYSKIQRCLAKEQKFVKYKYDKILETIIINEYELVKCEQKDGYISLSTDENQYCELNVDSEIILPKVYDFTKINLFIKAIESSILIFDRVTWINSPNLRLGELNLITLTYINGIWYGEAGTYVDNNSGNSSNTDEIKEELQSQISELKRRVELLEGYHTGGSVPPGETTYTITKNLSNCSSDNNINSVTEGSSYTTVITANDSTTMNSISVLMNGVDVTNEYATPIYGETTYTITRNLSNCSSSNASTSISEGSSYTTNITANNGYTLSSIRVTMGGYDISSTVVNGNNINIPNVTGNIVINATAESSGFTFTKYKRLDEGILVDYTDTSEVTYYATVGFNEVEPGSSYNININLCTYICVCYYDENKNYITYTEANADDWSEKAFSTTITIPSNTKYIRVCATNNGTQVTGTLTKNSSGGFTFTKYKRLDDGILVDYTDESQATYYATVNMNPVTPGNSYTINIISCNYMCVCYYDSNQNYITYTEANADDWSVKQLSTTITIPSDARYIRVCVTNTGAQVIGTLTENTGGNFTFTKYKRLDNGVLVDYTDTSEATYYATVNMNTVTAGSKYIININLCTYICVCYYDGNGDYVTYSEANPENWSEKQLSTIITIPSNIRYIRVCATNSGTQVVGTLSKITIN